MSEGKKYDQEKSRLELIPPDALAAVGYVFGYGAKKYGAYNWNGVEQTRYYAAAMRHLTAWMYGENNDPESGMLHLAHAACSSLILLSLALRGKNDDRPPLMDQSEIS